MRKCGKDLAWILGYFLLLYIVLYSFPSLWKNQLVVNRNYGGDKNFATLLEGPVMGDDPHLVNYLRENFLTPPSNLSYNLARSKKVMKTEPFLGNVHFQSFVLKTFKRKANPGFFIEAGALDGEVGSNTLWLEMNRNWTGLLIEPYKESCTALKAKHRKAWTSCSCISPQKYAQKSIFEIPNTHKYDFNSFWLYKANVRSLRSRFRMLIDESASFTYSRAQCFPLITYLLALNITSVDLLSLDTQGGEKSMLLSLPFDKIKIKYIFIEYIKKRPNVRDKDMELVSFLDSKGFDLLDFSEKHFEYIFGAKNHASNF